MSSLRVQPFQPAMYVSLLEGNLANLANCLCLNKSGGGFFKANLVKVYDHTFKVGSFEDHEVLPKFTAI